jgi:hypothetical protein
MVGMDVRLDGPLGPEPAVPERRGSDPPPP